MLLKFLNGIILLHICSEFTIINVWFQQHGEMGTLPCEAMAQTPKSCLLLLVIVVDLGEWAIASHGRGTHPSGKLVSVITMGDKSIAPNLHHM